MDEEREDIVVKELLNHIIDKNKENKDIILELLSYIEEVQNGNMDYMDAVCGVLDGIDDYMKSYYSNYMKMNLLIKYFNIKTKFYDYEYTNTDIYITLYKKCKQILKEYLKFCRELFSYYKESSKTHEFYCLDVMYLLTIALSEYLSYVYSLVVEIKTIEKTNNLNICYINKNKMAQSDQVVKKIKLGMDELRKYYRVED